MEYADLKNKKVVVIGLGKSGVSVANFCLQQGAQVTVTDDLPEKKLSDAMAGLAHPNIKTSLGGISSACLLQADLIVLSPGVPRSHPAIIESLQASIPLVGEVELASWFIQAPIVGITGTNGKSTVTSLCGAIATETGRPTFCGGNLGTPLIEAVGTHAASAQGIVVCELSSFQLESILSLRCHAATILNITPDHLDRYPSFEAYGNTKANIFRNQHVDQDILVLNADDGHVLSSAERNHPQGNRYFFSARPVTDSHFRRFEKGGFRGQQDLILHGLPHFEKSSTQTEHYPTSDLQIIGQHNLGNALASFLLMRASGLATYEQVRRAGRAFLPLAHRMQKIAEWNGITFYDDSKATNVDAVVAGLQGFPKPFALIAGGRDKGGSYAPMAKVLQENQVRGVVLIGEAAPLIEKALHPKTKALLASSMEEAVEKATMLCQSGDAVVLSPACSSYDMFSNYAHRAEIFCQSVGAFIHNNPLWIPKDVP